MFINLFRRERLVKEHPNDNAQLLTGVQFDQGVVGKALKGNNDLYFCFVQKRIEFI